MKRIVAIVQARMSSSRLPNKVLLPLCGKEVLWHVFNQLSYSKMLTDIILATSLDPSDDKLELWAIKNQKKYFRGDLNNVLKRFYDTSRSCDADIIVRITADCPLIDPKVVDSVIEKYQSGEYDYVSNTNPPTFPDGLDAEVFSFDSLKEAYFNAKLKSELEHVTPFIRNHPEKFRIGNYASEENHEHLRWTIDNNEDYILLSKIFENLFKEELYIDYKKVIQFLEGNKKLLEINSSIKRNEGFEKSLKEDKE